MYLRKRASLQKKLYLGGLHIAKGMLMILEATLLKALLLDRGSSNGRMVFREKKIFPAHLAVRQFTVNSVKSPNMKITVIQLSNVNGMESIKKYR